MSHEERARVIAEARAVMASKRASLCRHGCAVCHECDAAKTTTTEAAEAGNEEQR